MKTRLLSVVGLGLGLVFVSVILGLAALGFGVYPSIPNPNTGIYNIPGTSITTGTIEPPSNPASNVTYPWPSGLLVDTASYCTAFRAYFRVSYCNAGPGGGGANTGALQIIQIAGSPPLLFSLTSFGVGVLVDVRLVVLFICFLVLTLFSIYFLLGSMEQKK